MVNYREIRGGNKCIIWTRVSTKRQEENGGSLQTQEELCRDYALQNGLSIIDVGDKHGVFGGTHESAKTPGKMIKEMVKAVKKDKSIRWVLVSEFDRFSRSNGQAITILEDLRSEGVIVKAVRTGIDTSTKDGFMMARNSLNVAEWDNDNRVDKFYMGRQACMRHGAWIEKAPIGYYKVGKSRNTYCYLDEQGRLIKQAFQWKLNGDTNALILKKLAARGMHITKQTLNHIFNNIFYAGKIKTTFIEEIVDGQIEQAVSYKDWLEVQKIMSSRSGKYKHKKEKPECPLTHHIICADCGTPLTSYRVKSKRKDYYKCNKIGCKNNISAKEMHDKYQELLGKYDLPIELLSQYENNLRKLLRVYTDEIETQKTLLSKRLTEVDKQIKECYMKYATNKLDIEAYEVVIQELKKRKADIESELQEYGENLSNYEKVIPEIIVTCSKLGSLWRDSELHTKQKIQNLVFPDGILWDKEKRCYRTENCNEFFNILNKLSISYGYKKETPSQEDVSMCAG